MDTHTYTPKALAVPSIKLCRVAVDSGGRFTTPAVMKLNQSLPEYDALLRPHSFYIQTVAQKCDELCQTHMSQTQSISFFFFFKCCYDGSTCKTALGTQIFVGFTEVF